ncbi:3-hydroxyacyl-ACP dehydratase FabZ [Wenzhouxiangella marina]|uniref:3-hydroxyacyl-[acyl-carrier-protein] dehydratase FabZ n=1 Tax=Wenzhouxiangella marina TaxID=1579979 RepID=A0A0K0XSZ9_9GAMM|nr:3-hydroxyacyl-ACP dehydratase FabZ [Wenzhouxiangella marina]AKS40813.1 3-hydroxyacyl-[acyl-carrier-protein] dehydratase FabZ [Wenzhouxiangella marina]MBB6087687.1 3-hydroxyacyl-[acyl-carrier-protein] dehydratase [Wenzhouxiangella marina]
MSEQTPIDIETILGLLPHRYPFLLVDRVLEYHLDAPPRIRALKNVTMNEPFFQGHFPGHPVMPGVLILEAMAQAAGCLAHLAREAEQAEEQLYYLVKIDKARFNRVVVPGDQLIFEVEQKRLMRGMGLYTATTLVDGKTASSAEILCAARPASAK